MKRALTALLAAALLCGCAYVHSTTSRTYSVAPDGKTTNVVETTKMTGYAMLEANVAANTLRNQSSVSGSTNRTYAPGTYIGGVNESASNNGLTNVIRLLQAIAVLSGGM